MAILTPDQKLRVFVSSTLQELAAERAVVRDAIESLRLAPVMFEMGARTHPPRNLYRAYLEQSHVFIGIYWESYGWVAPGMDISGLEDEYVLSEGMPRLIYVKKPAEREERLTELLDRVAGRNDIVFRKFDSAQALHESIQDDLAMLLTERFTEAATRIETETPTAAALPVQLTRFIGREKEVRDVSELLCKDGVRLLTLLGPGGIGKTRLSIEAARSVDDQFDDGVRFVSLAPLRDPERLADFIMETLGIKENTADSQGALGRWLHDRNLLLVLDNFEQLIDATRVVTQLLEGAPRCKILISSRSALRVRGEHEYFVPPLTLADDRSFAQSDACALFSERAREVRPDVELPHKVVAAICKRLDGLPLAIELAAARTKVMSPEQLLQRLCSRLDVLTGGARDLPERQQTLRATIDWSYQLLDEDEKTLLARLAVFRRGATLDAIEQVCTEGDIDVLEGVASLIEKSLVMQEVAETGEARFWMLETIREFAVELFEAGGDCKDLKDRHARFFAEFCREAYEGTAGRDQQRWISKVELDYANIRLAANRLLERGGAAVVAEMAWHLTLFTWVAGHMADARAACKIVLETPDIDALSRARALVSGGVAAFWQGDIGEAVPMLVEAKGLFETLDDELGYAQSLIVLGMVAWEFQGLDASKEMFDQAIETFEKLGNDAWVSLTLTAYCWIFMLSDQHEGMTEKFEYGVELAQELGAELTLGMSYGNLGMHRLWQGRADEALAIQMKAIKPLAAADHTAAISYTLLNTAEVLAALGRCEDAARLVGLSVQLLDQLEVLPISLMEARRVRVGDELRKEMGADAYEAAVAAGTDLGIDEALQLMAANIPAPV
jgi:predicted ATPase